MNNPIIRGFHPDPSIVRLGSDYYIATSTFEWFPGAMIYHSKDLVNWNLIKRPLDRLSLLDMKGIPDSCGVWAPCLSHDGDQFHLVYSVVRSFDGVWKDTPNFLSTAKEISGPWSDPVYLGSQGFDGSMFHDEDGKKWYLSMRVDHRRGKMFGGIILQEYDPRHQELVGPEYYIFEGSDIEKTEGPHLYLKDGYYYLLTAEGGTEYGHAATIARSKDITGPYEISPYHPLLSSAGNPDLPLQKTGHGDFVQTLEGKWYLVFLTGRPLSPLGNCPLGRETAIEEIIWPTSDWPRLSSGKHHTRVVIPSLSGIDQSEKIVEQIVFPDQTLPDTYMSLRVPINEDWLKIDTVEGYLELKGRESLSSTFEQSHIARRLQSFYADYTAVLDIEPDSFQHMAGLTCYYNTGHYLYLSISQGNKLGTRIIQLIKSDNFNYQELLSTPVDLPLNGKIALRTSIRWDKISFSYSTDLYTWQEVQDAIDLGFLSDDNVRDGSDRYRPAFTGTFLGICCQDLSGRKNNAKIYSLKYEELGK